jgi:hypothetical protein
MDEPVSGTGSVRQPGGRLGLVLGSLERAVQVDLIATYDLVTCRCDDRCADILEDEGRARYDQFPVLDEDRVVGVLERDVQWGRGTLVRDVMRPLDDSVLVASSAGVLSYIRMAAESPYHLVVKEERIRGIVTPSDLLKLPVRLVLFALITHLESTMAELIARRFPNEEWRRYLSEGRRQKIDEMQQRLKDRGLDSDLVLLTELRDKRDIVAKGIVPCEQQSAFKEELQGLGELRNIVMHSNNYLTDLRYLRSQVEAALRWIDWLEGETESNPRREE